jgi:hypothetical protein
MAPFGMKTAPKRSGGLAGILACAVSAGTIASRNGNAMAAPTPRRNVRRGNDILVMNIGDTFTRACVQFSASLARLI